MTTADLPITAARIVAIYRKKEVIFIPLPVDPGDDPIKHIIIINNKIGEPNAAIGIRANPVLRNAIA